jgi:hypothetical protein
MVGTEVTETGPVTSTFIVGRLLMLGVTGGEGADS